MARSLQRWVLILVAFWALGPAAAMLMNAVRAPDGGPDASIFLSESPIIAIAAAAAAFVLALLVGVIGSRMFGTRSGLFIAGLVIVWPAWTAGTVMGILRGTQSPHSLWTLALEGLLVAASTFAVAFIIDRAQPIAPNTPNILKAKPPSASLPIGPIAALLAGIIAAFACAQTEMPGQAVAAAFFAGLLGSLVGTLADPRTRLAWLVAPLALLAFIGPASAAILDGDAAIPHLYAGTITPLARLTPLHWAAGLLLGVPVGASWAAGMLKKPATT